MKHFLVAVFSVLTSIVYSQFLGNWNHDNYGYLPYGALSTSAQGQSANHYTGAQQIIDEHPQSRNRAIASRLTYLEAAFRILAKETRTNILETNAKMAVLTNKLEGIMQAPGQATTGLIDKDPSIETMKTDLKGLKDILAQITNELEETKLSLATVEADLQSTTATLTGIKSELADTKSSLETVQTDLQSTTDTLAQTRNELSAAQSSLETVKTELASTIDTLADVKTELANTKSSLEAAKTDLQTTMDSLAETKLELKDTKSSLETVKTDLQGITVTLAETNSELEEAKLLLTNVQTDLASTKGSLTETIDALANTQTQVDGLSTNLDDATDRIAVLESKFNAFTCTCSADNPKTIDKIPSSCADLKEIGYVKSGIYSLLGAKQVETVYCDFTKDSQNFIGYQDVKSKPIYFYVQKNQNFLTSNTPITYDITTINVGTDMNIATGKFTAPVKGTYFFSFNGVVQFDKTPAVNSYLAVTMHKDGQVEARSQINEVNGIDQKDYLSPISVQSTLTLDAGDQVWMQVDFRNGLLFDGIGLRLTNFNGWLLEEEIAFSL